MTPKTITLPADLYQRVEQEAQSEGKTADEVAIEAVKRELARRWLERTRREAEIRRGSMTDEEVEAAVDTAVQGWRRDQHGR
jgi:predicted transcriptional regulator